MIFYGLITLKILLLVRIELLVFFSSALGLGTLSFAFLVFINDLLVDTSSIQCVSFSYCDCVSFYRISCFTDHKCLDDNLRFVFSSCQE